MAIFTASISEVQFDDGSTFKVKPNEVQQVLANLRDEGFDVLVF